MKLSLPRRALFAPLSVLLWLGAISSALAAEPVTIRVGVLKFGTVNWTLDVVQEQGLAAQEGVALEIVPLAMKNATNVALQGGAVDIIVNDWIWVSRQRAEGQDYTFVPYSRAVGSLMVRPDAGIQTLADLRGKRLGVAGGPVDKSWLLLRAYARKTLGEDIARWVEPNFAAPPLLNELVLRGELPAALNFWHYSARLKARGMQELLTVAGMLPALGVEEDVPMIGWVFDESWAEENRESVEGFLRATRKAGQLLAESDEIWERLRPATGAEDDATFSALREGYRAGIPQHFGEEQRAAARRLLEILAAEGGQELVGKSATLSPGTFWNGYTF